MDLFKQAQYRNLGIGGLKCPCCTHRARKRGRKDKTFNKVARTYIKRLTIKELKIDRDVYN